jgi:hypothetical protein
MQNVDVTADRVARNQATFRDANEKIQAAAGRIGLEGEPVPFLCECPQRECTEIARLTLDDYETVRGRSTWFLVLPGHEFCEVDGTTVARIAEHRERFTIMEKVGEAAEIVAELDPRS